jgi:hypothetical protein
VLGQAQQEPPKGEQRHGAEKGLGYQSSHEAVLPSGGDRGHNCAGQKLIRHVPGYAAPHTTNGFSVIACPEPSVIVT